MPRLITVSEAASSVGRSPQWVRDQFRAGRVTGTERPAGSRIRLLVDGDEVERLIAGHQRRVEDTLTVDSLLIDGLANHKARLEGEVASLRSELAKVREELALVKADNASLVRTMRLLISSPQ